jgi:hypothetical protein
MGLGNGSGQSRNGRCRFWRRGRVLLLLLPLLEQLHHVAGLGNLGEINLRLDLGRGSLLPGSRARFGRQMLSYFFGFILFNRARMGFFLGDADFLQHIENRFCFYFKLSG